MDFLPFLKAVGTGKKHNRDLSADEMDILMRAILDGELYPEQISAFLLGWRVKGESLEEFDAALKVFNDYIIPQPIPDSIEFGYPYDGKVKNPYLIFLTAKYLERFDLKIVLHGDALQSAKAGTLLKDICEHIRLPDNVHYFDRADFFAELHRLSNTRGRLGIRTSLNTLEKLTGVAQSKTAIIGAFHKPFIDKYIALFRNRYETLIIIKGNEGTPEIFSKCSVIVVNGDKIYEFKADPQAYGIEDIRSKTRISLKESLAHTQSPNETLEKLSKFNAAVLLYATKKAESIEEGLERLK